jgi:hypothetical protein
MITNIAKFLWLPVLAVAACSTMEVSSNAAPGAADRAASYHTYAWMPQPANRDANHSSIVEAQVKQEADRDLQAKGYRQVAPSNAPDFLVGWHSTTQQKTEVRELDPYYGYGWYGGLGGYGGSGWGGPDSYVTQYTQGTLILDIVDAGTKKLTWRGSAQANLGTNPSQGTSTQKKIRQATDKILDRFPPKA